MASGLFRMIASLGRTLVVVNTLGTFICLVFFILGGFLLSKDDIAKWLRWGVWISPVMYCQNALSNNDFLSPHWNKPQSGSNPDEATIGRPLLHERGLFAAEHWYWICIMALIGFTILYNVLFTIALKYLHPPSKWQATISMKILENKNVNCALKELPRSVSYLHGQNSEQTESSSPGISRTNDTRDAACSTEMTRKKGMVLRFKKLTVSFDDINYYVQTPAEMKQQGIQEARLQLLQNITGTFRPGILTVLMGVSGAGKTMLFDVLTGRKTWGIIEGSIRISGFPKKAETFACVCGYCEQNDIHSPNVTVYESLVFSVSLRVPAEVDPKTRRLFMEEIMELVELSPVRNAIVGFPGLDGLSTEQQKRLTIAVEIVANPSIIFMDEPTSGLDARAAAVVMRTIRAIVETGRTIACTIHQPSINIFEAFDELILMKRGGKIIYSGPLGRQFWFYD